MERLKTRPEDGEWVATFVKTVPTREGVLFHSDGRRKYEEKEIHIKFTGKGWIINKWYKAQKEFENKLEDINEKIKRTKDYLII